MRFIFSALIMMLMSISVTATQSAAGGEDFGIVMDVTGEVFVERAESKTPAEIGVNINSGDRMILTERAAAVVVSYDDCQEWVISGPDTILISTGQVKSKNLVILPVRQLPVCYSLEDINETGSDVMGGFVLRGAPKDPLASLREEFGNGKASNTTLITLIMHDVNNGKIEQAENYFSILKERVPDSALVKALSKKFNKAR